MTRGHWGDLQGHLCLPKQGPGARRPSRAPEVLSPFLREIYPLAVGFQIRVMCVLLHRPLTDEQPAPRPPQLLCQIHMIFLERPHPLFNTRSFLDKESSRLAQSSLDGEGETHLTLRMEIPNSRAYHLALSMTHRLGPGKQAGLVNRGLDSLPSSSPPPTHTFSLGSPGHLLPPRALFLVEPTARS